MYSHSAVALIFLAEAHVTMSVALGHTGVIHHEKIHFEAVRARPLDLIVLGSYELDHLHTTYLQAVLKQICMRIMRLLAHLVEISPPLHGV